jgi:hypothetical protein
MSRERVALVTYTDDDQTTTREIYGPFVDYDAAWAWADRWQQQHARMVAESATPGLVITDVTVMPVNSPA